VKPRDLSDRDMIMNLAMLWDRGMGPFAHIFGSLMVYMFILYLVCAPSWAGKGMKYVFTAPRSLLAVICRSHSRWINNYLVMLFRRKRLSFLLYNHTQKIHLASTKFNFWMECRVTFRHNSSYVSRKRIKRRNLSGIQAHISNTRRNI
jgi:hypothetical protein